jgi:hypothetical protein
MPTSSAYGKRLAAIQARFRASFGEPGECPAGSGKTFSVISASLERRDRDYLPEGVASNAADADLRVFNATAADFGAGSADWPIIGTAWKRAADGAAYTILGVRPEVVSGVVIALRLLCFRTPPADAATVETASDLKNGAPVTPGVRKSYRPPDNQG